MVIANQTFMHSMQYMHTPVRRLIQVHIHEFHNTCTLNYAVSTLSWYCHADDIFVNIVGLTKMLQSYNPKEKRAVLLAKYFFNTPSVIVSYAVSRLELDHQSWFRLQVSFHSFHLKLVSTCMQFFHFASRHCSSLLL